MNLHSMLAARAEQGRPIRVGLLVEGNFDLLRRPTASPIVQGFEQ